MLIRSHIFKQCGGFDEDLQTNQEYKLMIHMAQITKFDFIPEVLTVVYVTEGQISTNFKKKRDGTIHYTFYKEKPPSQPEMRFRFLHQANSPFMGYCGDLSALDVSGLSVLPSVCSFMMFSSPESELE